MRNKKDKTYYTNTTNDLRKRQRRFLSLTGFTPLETIDRQERRKMSLMGFTLLLFFKICFAQDFLPFQGEINTNNINIRSDATVNSQIICTVNRGAKVEIVSEFYEWYKIRLPKLASLYIKKNMVECIKGCESAKVIKDRVNVRLHPNESSPILGRTTKFEIIIILKDKGDWFKIEPIQNSFGWINKRFVDKLTVVSKIQNSDLTVDSQESITLIGIIKPYGKIIKRIATHKLITEDNKTFLLKGNKKDLDKLNNYKVKIAGKIIHSKQKYPVVEINLLEIIN